MEFPEQIRLKGLPLSWCGWNSFYEKTSMESDGCPVYHMNSYYLCCVIGIIGVYIERKNGRWRLVRESEYRWGESAGLYKCGEIPQEDPFGDWATLDGSITAEVVKC